MILKLKNQMGLVNNVPYSKVKTYIAPWTWERMMEGGHGELIEELTWLSLTTICDYSNLTRKGRADFWDIELSNDDTIRVDIRRISKEGNINLGHTSGTRSRIDWEYKADELMNGGYFGILLQKTNMGIYYIPANILLNSGIKTSNEVPVARLNARFSGLNIPLDETIKPW